MNLRITTRERIHPCCLCHKRLFTLCLLQKVKVKNNRGRAAFWLLAFVCCWARKRGRKSQQSWVLCRGAVQVRSSPHTLPKGEWADFESLETSGFCFITPAGLCVTLDRFIWVSSLLQGFELDHNEFDQVMQVNLMSPRYHSWGLPTPSSCSAYVALDAAPILIKHLDNMEF